MPTALDAGNAATRRPQAIALGERLFFDARLSRDGMLSCASCHRPELAFADGRARGVGREALDRNTPSLWNAVHERWYGWDGAADSLWSQAIRPILDTREMAATPAHVRVRRLSRCARARRCAVGGTLSAGRAARRAPVRRPRTLPSLSPGTDVQQW
jgi:cytochrome c peroxidase